MSHRLLSYSPVALMGRKFDCSPAPVLVGMQSFNILRNLYTEANYQSNCRLLFTFGGYIKY